MIFTTDLAVDNLLNAILGQSSSTRDEYILRQSLQNLVRLAKTEQFIELQAQPSTIPKRHQVAQGLAQCDLHC